MELVELVEFMEFVPPDKCTKSHIMTISEDNGKDEENKEDDIIGNNIEATHREENSDPESRIKKGQKTINEI